MRAITDQEKRTIRIGAIVLGLGLLALVGKHLEARRSEYRQLVTTAQALKLEIQPYEDKAIALKRLMESFRLDPAKLSKATVVAEASSAIQKVAQSGGIQFGPVRESPGRAAVKELASIRLEGSGPILAIITFLHRLETIGYPVIIDSVQFTPETTRPGMAKLSVTIIIMDFEQWKNSETPNV